MRASQLGCCPPVEPKFWSARHLAVSSTRRTSDFGQDSRQLLFAIRTDWIQLSCAPACWQLFHVSDLDRAVLPGLRLRESSRKERPTLKLRGTPGLQFTQPRRFHSIATCIRKSRATCRPSKGSMPSGNSAGTLLVSISTSSNSSENVGPEPVRRRT